MRRFDHIDLRVPDLEAVREFYSRLLPALGFKMLVEVPDWISYVAEPAVGETASEFFGITGDPTHVPNGTRIAFWAKSEQDVDMIGRLLPQIGAQAIEGPELYDAPGYYAVFFEYPCGNKLEVCHRTMN